MNRFSPISGLAALESSAIAIALALAPESSRAADLDTHQMSVDATAQLFIPVTSDGQCPRQRASANIEQLRAACDEYAREAAQEQKRHHGQAAAAFRNLVNECRTKYVDIYSQALAATYSMASIADVSAGMKASGGSADIECLLVQSHNAYVREKLREIDERDAVRRELARRSYEPLVTTPRSPPEESTGQRLLRGLGAVLQGVGQGMAGSNSGFEPPSGTASSAPLAPPSVPEVHAPAAPQVRAPSMMAPSMGDGGCTSDYSCGVGYTCVKDNYSGSGYCFKSVNEYGVQQYGVPSPGSAGVKVPSATDCRFDTDCAPGFRCESSSGACVR